jgi:ParB family chromosome partitioning protein
MKKHKERLKNLRPKKKPKTKAKTKMAKPMTAPVQSRGPISGGPARLGKGLSAIFADADPVKPDSTARIRNLPIEQISANPDQPRKHFEKEALKELADSIKEKGILQPILVRPHSSKPNSYEIVAGERRWRASQLAGLHEVPVIVRDIKDKETLELALIENIQREDLTAIEEAETFQRLMDEFGHSQEELGEALGKSRAHVGNMLRLNGLPESVKDMVKNGALTAGHARAILGAKDPVATAEEVVKNGLSVRQTENLVKVGSGKAEKTGMFDRAPRKGSAKARVQEVTKDADVLKLEREVSTWLGLKVKLTPRAKGGNLSIEYGSLDQLEDVLARLSRPVKMG